MRLERRKGFFEMAWTDGLEHILREQEPLAARNWLRLGGAAQFLAEPTNQDELQILVRRCREDEVPVRLLGGGSNVLIPDEGLPGVVVSLTAADFAKVEVQGQRIRAGGGARLGQVVSVAAREGLAGIESLVAIPGTVGGGLHGNAGTQIVDLGQWTQRAMVMTRAGEIIERSLDDMHFSYRNSTLDELVILEADFALNPDDPRDVTRRLQKEWIVRRARQPSDEIPCGRIFKDHGGMEAREILEEAGLKGTRVGGAEVSEQQPNYVIVHPEGTSSDVLRLIELMDSQVRGRCGVELETEIEIW